MNSITKRRFQIIIGFAIISFAVIVSYYSIEEVNVTTTPQYDIFLVIDVSGSMNSEEKIIFAKQAALEFIEEFHLDQSSKHRIGLVSFANTGNLLVQLDTNAKNNLRHGINNLHPDGATAMGDGISIATESFSQDTRPDTEKVIVLLSDGMSNTGSNPLLTAQTAADKYVRIFSVGYGFSADVQTLKAVASLTNGKYFNAPTGEDLAVAFNEIADVLISPISHYSSRILILIAIPILLFIPTIEKSLTTIMRRNGEMPKQKTEAGKRNEIKEIGNKFKQLTQQKQLVKNCSSCNATLKPTSKFCGKCGTSVKGKVTYAKKL